MELKLGADLNEIDCCINKHASDWLSRHVLYFVMKRVRLAYWTYHIPFCKTKRSLDAFSVCYMPPVLPIFQTCA